MLELGLADARQDALLEPGARSVRAARRARALDRAREGVDDLVADPAEVVVGLRACGGSGGRISERERESKREEEAKERAERTFNWMSISSWTSLVVGCIVQRINR